jgi:hypothetical protein
MENYHLLLPKEIILMIFKFNDDDFLTYSRVSKWCRKDILLYILPTNTNLQIRIIKILSKNNRFAELNQFLYQGSQGQFKKFHSIIINWFLKCNKLELFQILLKLPENIFNITKNDNELFRVSLRENSIVLVKLLLTDKRIIPPVDAIKMYILDEIMDNHMNYPSMLEMATILIDYCKGFEHCLYRNAIYKGACGFCKMLILKDKLDLKKIYKKDCRLFMDVDEKEIITKFLNDPSIDPFSLDCIMQALAKKGYTDLFIMLVNKLQGKFTEDYRKSLYSACEYDKFDIVKILLQDKRYTSQTINNAIKISGFYNKFKTLETLINDTRSDPKYYMKYNDTCKFYLKYYKEI